MTFERWENGVTEIDEEHINQLIDAWENVFGVTGPNPTRITKLGLPVQTADPISPIPGSFWMRSNEGGPGGLLKYRDGNGNTVPIRPTPQTIYGTPLGAAVSVLSTTWIDVAGLNATIHPTTGYLKIRLSGRRLYNIGGGSGLAVTSSAAGAASEPSAGVRIVLSLGGVDFATLADYLLGGGLGASKFIYTQPGAFVWDYDVPGPYGGAGNVVARVQIITGINSTLSIQDGVKVVLEEVPGL